ncbi:MAG TPA: ribose 5-phosphate isomerase B [Candidatus Scatomorpha stercorigallinarum]|nr:ribose 5-phosphate isomerase B [Candidatus Scatomorpha stercorigallinarum]
MIAIGSDHGGYALKQVIISHLADRGIEFRDFGTYSEESCDYPEYGEAVGRAVASGECELGIAVCGTGIGISIAANKVHGVRAAACSDCYTAEMCRRHNDANVLALGGRVIGPGLALKIVDIFLSTGFDGGRHARRLGKLAEIEARD